MKLLALALAAAVTLAAGACGQRNLSAERTVPAPAIRSYGTTGVVEPGGSVTGTERGQAPEPPYIVPAHPRAPSGDDGRTAGKTNPD